MSLQTSPSLVRGWFSDWGGKLTLLYSGILAFHLLYVTFHFGGDEWASLISNIVAPAIYSGPCVLAWRVSRDQTLADRTRLAWRFVALANFSFMTGEIIWLVLENGLDLKPFPSIADIGYLAFYPLMMCGLLCSVEKFRSRAEMIDFWLDASVVMLAGGMILWRLLVRPLVAAGGEDQLTTVLSVAYPIGDLVLLLGISSLMLRRSGFSSRAPINLVLAGVIINFFADFVFGYQTLQGTYVTGAPVDALFTLACFPVMLGAHLEKVRAARAADPTMPAQGHVVNYFWLPYVAVGIVYLVLLHMIVGREDSDLETMYLVGGFVTILVIARQFMFVRENVMVNAAVNALQRRIEGIYSASSDAIGLATHEGTLTEVNEAFERLTGYDRADIIGKMRYQDFVPDDPIDVTHEPNLGSHPAEHDRELVRKDGEKRFVSAAIYAVDEAPSGPSALAVVIRDMTVRRALQRELSHQARHDSLTGLANRSMLLERVSAGLSRARRRSGMIALLFIDLDNFKIVNDTLGHAAGDELLTVVARRLRDCLRASDTAARLGGDEFAVLLEDLTADDEPNGVADRIISLVRQPINIGGKDVFVGSSIGIATSDSAFQADDLLRNADVAMYAAKRGGKNRIAIFEPEMQAAVAGRAKLEIDLRSALEKEEFEVRYQPIVDLLTGDPVAVEALVRWKHPDGDIAPSVFIPVAEETGTIQEIGQFVLEQASDQTARWNSDVRLRGRLAVSVNVSSRQLLDVDFVANLVKTCDCADLPLSELILEITETALISNAEATVRLLERLRELGVRIAIDDFGTGYSSLSYLHKFPFNILKVDGAYVGKLGDAGKGAALVRAIVSMSRSLGLTTVAEGIEDPSHVDILTSVGCEWGQGYFVAPPLTASEMNSFLLNYFAVSEESSAITDIRRSNIFPTFQPSY